MRSGLELMVVGMGVVFLFLTLLIGVVSVMALIVRRYAPPIKVTGSSPASEAKQNNEIVAVITAGIHAYRRNRQ